MGSYQISLIKRSGLGRRQDLCEYSQSLKEGTSIADENTHRSSRYQNLMLVLSNICQPLSGNSKNYSVLQATKMIFVHSNITTPFSKVFGNGDFQSNDPMQNEFCQVCPRLAIFRPPSLDSKNCAHKKNTKLKCLFGLFVNMLDAYTVLHYKQKKPQTKPGVKTSKITLKMICK